MLHRPNRNRVRRGSPVLRCAAPALLLLLPTLAACSYQLQGVVIEGPAPEVLVVESNDRRLNEPGLRRARIEVTIDPRAMKPHYMEPVACDEGGRFAIPLSEMGAGSFQEYQVRVICRAEGYTASAREMPLPGFGKRLVIVMAQGRDTFRAEGDMLRETLKLGDQLMNPR